VLGIAAGLRTFTPLAAVFLARGGFWGYVLGASAVCEYAGDLLPNVPSRTSPAPLVARIVSAAVVGHFVASAGDWTVVVAPLIAVAGALLGAFGGIRLRLAAAARIGAIPAGLLEDVVAVGLAALAVTRIVSGS